jgi:hypothetical protein
MRHRTQGLRAFQTRCDLTFDSVLKEKQILQINIQRQSSAQNDYSNVLFSLVQEKSYMRGSSLCF